MAYYRTCPHCGCSLDPGERCECEKEQDASAEHPQQEQKIYALFEKEPVQCAAG